jgi:uncharacterized DUF497 family protein
LDADERATVAPAANRVKHGLSFETAVLVFDDPLKRKEDASTVSLRFLSAQNQLFQARQ